MADSNGKVSVTKKRKSRQELKNTVIATNPLKDYKNTRTAFWAELIIQGLPPWYLWIGKAMLDSDPLVRFALDIRNAMLMTAEIEVECDYPEIATWIKEQWDFLWTQHGKKVAAAKEFGFAPLQLIWKEDAKNSNLIISDCKEYAPEDAKALVLGNDIKGMKIKGTDVFSPQAMWMTFGSKYDQPYGNGILRRMYPPWFQKWMNHGSERLLQLRMIKDAYIGDIFWYPPNQLVEIPNGDGTVTSVPWRDVFRELSENRLSGNTLVLPRLVDDNNNPLTDYTPPQDTGGATSIFDWADRNDNKILQAASITREIIEAASSGSGFSGRSIPFLTTLSVCNEEVKEMIVGFRRPIETAIWLNWGIEPDFTIKPKNLVETFSDDIQGSALGGGAIGGQPSQVGQQPATVITPSGQEVQFAETMEHNGKKFQVHKNISLMTAYNLMENAKVGTLRGLRSKSGDYHLWDGYHATHEPVSTKLGYDWHEMLDHGERFHFDNKEELTKNWHKLTGGKDTQHAETKPKHVEGIYHADQVDDKDQHADFHRIVAAHGGKSYKLESGKHLFKLPADSNKISDFHAALEDNGHSPQHHQMEYDDEQGHALIKHGFKHDPDFEHIGAGKMYGRVEHLGKPEAGNPYHLIEVHGDNFTHKPYRITDKVENLGPHLANFYGDKKPKLKRIHIKPQQFAEKKKYVEGIYHADMIRDPEQQKHFHQLVREHGGKSYDLGTGKHLYKLPASSYTISDFHAAAEDAGHSKLHHQLEYEHDHENDHHLLKHGYSQSHDDEHPAAVTPNTRIYSRGSGRGKDHYTIESQDKPYPYWYHQNFAGKRGVSTDPKTRDMWEKVGMSHQGLDFKSLKRNLIRVHGKPTLKRINPETHQFAEHSYCSTQFNIPSPLAEEIKALGMQIPDVDLAEDGREDEIHVTTLFGIH